MRLFEILILVTISIVPFIWRRMSLRINPNFLSLGLIGLLLLQLVIEGYRWQCVPAYLLLIVLAVWIKVFSKRNSPKNSFFGFLKVAALVIFLIIAWFLPNFLPVFKLPQPRGEFNVGTRDVYFQTNRDELITEDSNDKRELLMKIWYPSKEDVRKSQSEKYIDETSRAGFTTKYGLPPSSLNYLDYVKTYAYPNLQVADGEFPVLIFSHGYGSKATGYYALISELASRGYIVINMNHTYESLGVSLPNGRQLYFDYAYQQKIAADAMKTIEPIQNAFRENLSFPKRHSIVQEAVIDYFEGDIQTRWAADMIDVLNLLPKWNSNGFLKGHLDLKKVGAIGHSVGGGAVGNLALKDDRIKAAVNLDGIQWGKKIDTTYAIPFLYVSADWPAEHEDINAHIYNKKSTDVFYQSKLLKSGHPNFMDIPFMIPVESLAGTGDIDPYLGIEIVTNLVSAFFDSHLKGLPNINIEKVGETYDLLELHVFEGDSVKISK